MLQDLIDCLLVSAATNIEMNLTENLFAFYWLPRGTMVIRELSVLANVRCSSSKAVIIFSIWSRLSDTVAPGWVLSHPDLDLVAGALLTTPAGASATVLRRHCFRYWLEFDGKDLSCRTEACV